MFAMLAHGSHKDTDLKAKSATLTQKGIKKAETDDNYLYIYEYFGYVVKSDEVYNIYSNALSNEIITSYNVTENFTNTESLKEYKWTYKKSSDNNYYFVSVTPII